MNLIRSYISSPKHYTIAIQKLSTFSTTQDYTPTNHTPLTWSQTLKKQPLTSPSTCPIPSQIPYQPNLPYFVNLFGTIQIPIQFQSTPDGKNIAATIIAQKDGAFIDNSSNSVFIPVVFEDDLAYSVAAHVKVYDSVYVTGKVSLNALPFVLSQSQGECYLVGNEIKFVQGLDVENSDVVKEQVGVGDRKCGVETLEDEGLKGAIEGFERLDLDSFISAWACKKVDELNLEDKSSVNVGGTTEDADLVLNSWRDLVKNPMDWCDYREDKSIGLVTAKYPDFKHKTNGTALWLNTAPNWVLAGGLEGLNVGKGKKEDSWKDLIENPDKWFDRRPTKTNVKAPDFIHTETGEGLWLHSSPKWVLAALDGLNVGKGKKEDSWRSLVENPDKWWDKRTRKTNVKVPDFVHKGTREGLWLDSCPKWVLAVLDGLNVGKGKKENSWKSLVENPHKWWDNRLTKTSNLKAPDFIHKETNEALWLDSSPKWVLAGPEGPYVGKGEKEDSWKNLVENPDKWLDNRTTKINANAPDFLHKETGEALWLNNSPKWILSQVPCQEIEHNVDAVNMKGCVT